MKPFLSSADWILTSLLATTTKIRTVDRSIAVSRPAHFFTQSTYPATCVHHHTHSWTSTVRFSAIHFRGWKIRQVSSYTLLSQFRLPWPWPCCLYKSTPFLVSSWADILAFYPDVRCIPHRQFCLPELAH